MSETKQRRKSSRTKSRAGKADERSTVKPGLASIKDAMVHFGVSRPTIERMIADGTLSSVKVHGRRRLRWSEIEKVSGTAPRFE